MNPSNLILNGRVAGGTICLALLANRAYRIEPGRRAVPLNNAVPVSTEPTYAPSSNDGAGRRLTEEAHATAMAKPLTDVLVRGAARSQRGPVAMLETGVRVGDARKAVRAIGNRRIVAGAERRLSFTAPERFSEMPLLWDHAYGGRDAYAERVLSKDTPRDGFGRKPRLDLGGLVQITYPRNAAGRGYYLDLDRDRLDGILAPNLEDPTDPITPDRLLSSTTRDWIERPVAACYEPIDLFTFPRATFLIRPAFDPPTRPVHELGTGAILRADLDKPVNLRALGDPRAYNSAPAGLAVCRLEGTERVSLWNLHARQELLEFDLPDDRPKLVLEPPGVAPRELRPLLQTVLIEPDLDRVTLTWAGVLPVAMPYPEEMTRSMRHAVVWTR